MASDDQNDGDGSLDRTLRPGRAPPGSERPPPARVLKGRWRLGRELGAGGMGVVYEAEQVNLKTRAAVKLLHPERLDSPDAIQRLLREARVAGIADHPGVTQVLDFDVTPDGRPFIAMELLEGMTLEEAMRRPGGVALAEGIELLLDVLGTLAAVHAAGIVHRDIKPGNIFVLEDGKESRTKLLDFGVARATVPDLEDRLTRTGDVIGTPHYMSPEVARGRGAAGPAADLWGVAVILYRLATGELPFTGHNYNDVIATIWTAEPAPAHARDPRLRPIARFLDRALAKDPAARFPDARAMADALARARDELVSSRPAAPTRRFVLLALAALLLVGGGVVVATRGAAKPEALRLAWTPYRDQAYMRKQTQGIRAALAGALGRDLVHVDADTYDHAVDLIVRREVDVAGLSPSSYLAARDRDPGLVLLARTLSQGVGTYQALIFVRAASPIRAVTDLEGKVFCFVAHGSTSGYAYPRALLRRAGVDPDTDLGGVRFSGDHQRAILMVDRGECDAAGASSSSLTEWALPVGVSPARFRILVTSPPIPQEALVARSGLAPAELDRLRAAVARVIDDTAGGKLPADRDISGLVPATERDYEVLRGSLE
jgi:phosphate/phosphite/phosphonate ABC transporter binding protein